MSDEKVSLKLYYYGKFEEKVVAAEVIGHLTTIDADCNVLMSPITEVAVPVQETERIFSLQEMVDCYKSGITQGVTSPKEANRDWNEMMKNYFKVKLNIDL